MMGGVETDLHGRTSMPRLFAAGEVACTGVHGANRLASNSLLEGLVFGARAAEAMMEPITQPVLTATLGEAVDGRSPKKHGRPFVVQELMWRDVGLVRSGEGLTSAVSQLGALWAAARVWGSGPSDRMNRRQASLATVGYLIARAALRREETRGGHFRADFPNRDDIHFQQHFADVLRA
jgi:L-aspartate oxidase